MSGVDLIAFHKRWTKDAELYKELISKNTNKVTYC